MLRKFFKDYFSFTKKERVGIIILVFVIIIIFVFPYLLPEKKDSINKANLEQFKTQSAGLLGKEKDYPTSTDQDGEGYPSTYHEPPGLQKSIIVHEKADSLKGELFYFDPNTLQQKGWEKLGLRAKTITTIQNYLSKGGRFRQAEDLGKIYGLRENELERLAPYVKISIIAKDVKTRANEEGFYPRNSYKFQPASNYPASASIIDINTADTTTLIELPGIGSKLAARILNFREKLGAFYAVDQLSDIYGLPDSTFQKIRPRLTVSAKEHKLLNINSADVNELRQLPYLKWSAANAIVEFRRQHGLFKNVDDLLQIDIFTPEMLKKMAPYLAVE